jgi:hypothetical protein
MGKDLPLSGSINSISACLPVSEADARAEINEVSLTALARTAAAADDWKDAFS